jgi:hypothetical protein
VLCAVDQWRQDLTCPPLPIRSRSVEACVSGWEQLNVAQQIQQLNFGNIPEWCEAAHILLYLDL